MNINNISTNGKLLRSYAQKVKLFVANKKDVDYYNLIFILINSGRSYEDMPQRGKLFVAIKFDKIARTLQPR